MRFDIIGGGKIILYLSESNIRDAISNVNDLISIGAFKNEQPEYVRSNPYMVYRYYNLDGSENREKTREKLIEAGFGGYLNEQNV